MIDAARAGRVKLMTAYRLHFEEGNLEAVRICKSGDLGEIRLFHSVFCQQVEENNVRLAYEPDQGGGPVFDMGVYCINAARYLFRDEPVEVTAFAGDNGERRFQTAGEMVSAVLRFPGNRMANFTVSFGAATVGRYIVVGTRGMLTADPASDYAGDIRLRVTVDGETQERTFPRRDQFGPELVYFSDCILNNREPEPSGEEGLIDVQIVRAIHRACENERAVPVHSVRRDERPEPSQKMNFPAVEEPELVDARMPSGDR